MSRAAPRLARIALELDLVADTCEDWPEESRAELRALARQVADFNPVRPVDLTLYPAQARVLVFLRKHIAERGFPPTRREIADAFGYSSENSAHDHLKRLEAKGVLTLIEGQARGIRLNQRTAAPKK